MHNRMKHLEGSMRCRERDTCPVKTNGWKTIDPFNKVSNVTSKS